MYKNILFIIFLLFAISTTAQNSKKVRSMKAEKAKIENNLKKSKADIAKNKKEQAEKTRQIAIIEHQIEQRVAHIHSLELDIDTTEQRIVTLQKNVDSLTAELDIKKARFAQGVRYARSQKLNLSPLVYSMAGATPSEILRRGRYARQYTDFQEKLGRAVMSKRDEVINARHKLMIEKDRMNNLLNNIIEQRKQLGADRQHQQDVLKGLVKTGKNLNSQLAAQQRSLNDINRKIEERIAYEIEQARKRAEEEARRKAEAERKRLAAEKAARTNTANSGRSNASKTTPSASSSSTKTSSSSSSSWLTSADRALSGSFVQNKGRMPVPITGNYMITARFGKYTPAGTKGVVLDNKGVDYTGQAGARARAIFDGEVSAVFEAGGKKHVLIRHGEYISAYCNLSSVIVSRGSKVRAKDLLGTVAIDDKGRPTLQLQLRRERTLLNPASWIGR